MKSKILISEKLPNVIIKRNLNVQNGNDAEILSASNLVNAFNAEIRWGSRNEDGSKIDLFISYEHPWIKGERIILLVQVKSGKSYGAVKNGKLKLYKRAFKEAKQVFNNICLIWLDQSTGKSYWSYIRPNSNSEVTEYGKNHLLSPCTRFEIARSISKNLQHNHKNGNGIIINIKESTLPLKLRRKQVRNLYKKNKKVTTPLLGIINFTEFGWKHMFRKSRKKQFKNDSLIVIPYLKKILKQYPTKHWINSFNKYTRSSYEFCQYSYVLTYDNISNNLDNNKFKVIIKLTEEIGYPIKWENEPMLSQKIMRKVIFKSCSLKKM